MFKRLWRRVALLWAAFIADVRFRLWLQTAYVPMAGGAADTQTLATADALLKDLYVGPMVEQLNNKTFMLDKIKRDTEHIDFQGRRAVVPLRVGRNVGRGSRSDGGVLPEAGRQKTVDAIYNMRYHYIGIELTDPTIEATKRSEGAFISAVELETQGATDDLQKDMNRQIFGTGDGLVATIASTGANTTHTLDSVQYLQVGDPVDVITKSNGVAVGTNPRSITARVGGATKTVTFSTSVTPTGANLDGVYIAGDRNNEIDGLRNLSATTGTVGALDRSVAANAFWKGKEKTAASAVAGESLFEQLADSIGAGGRAEVEVFLTTRGIRRRLADTYQSQKRFNDAKAVDIHGGYSAIMVNEIPVIADDDCPTGFAFGLNMSALKWYELAEPQWLEQADGRILSLKDNTTAGQKLAVWQGWFKWYATLGTHAANRLGRIILAADDDPE